MANAFDRTEQAMDTANTVRRDDRLDQSQNEDSLLTMDEQDAARRMLKDWDDSHKDIARFSEQWKVNRARSQGYTGVMLVKKQDKSEAHIPYGAKKNVAGLNKAARLKRRVRAVLFGDPPMAEATPSGDDDTARDHAEIATRVLQDVCSEGNLAYALHAGDAFDLGGDYGSGFLRFYVDPQGGGLHPKQIEADPEAVSAQDPYLGADKPGPKCILRYVTAEGMFTEDPKAAEQVWLPKLKDEVLTGKQVRFLPFGVRDLWEADGLMVGTAVPFGELKKMFPEIAKWPDERVKKLIESRPQHFKDILPPGKQDAKQAIKDSLVFVLTRYHIQSPVYPKGAYCIAAGADEMLIRQEWYDEEHGQPLDIPVTQFKQLTEEENPYGQGIMEGLGPGNEIRNAMQGAMLEHLDRFGQRRLFVPMTSTLQPHQLQSPTGTPIPILPGGEPKYEEIPDFPAIVEKMLLMSSADMDDESGLQQVGQGLNPAGVKSGLHAQTILEAVHQSLSDLKQNTERGLVRGWRIMLQLIRAYFTTPQQLRWVGNDGRYKERSWSNADLGTTREVRIQRGSFTQLTPVAKAELAHGYFQVGLLSKFDLDHVIEGNIGGLFGLQDNSHRMRVRRQIAQWNDGPPQQAMGAPPMAPMLPMMPQVDPMTGQPMPPPNPFAEPLAEIFDTRPADDEPLIAQLRCYELGRAISSTTFTRWPQPWREGLAQAYLQARQASQMIDAKSLEGMQKELEQSKQTITDQKIKAEAPNLNFSVAMTPLDQNQTMAVMQQVMPGLAVPPPMHPQPSPQEVMQHEESVALKTAAIQGAADTSKHKVSEGTKLEKEKIGAQTKLQSDDAGHKRNLELVGHMAKLVEAAKPAPTKRKTKVLRDKDGKVSGIEDADD